LVELGFVTKGADGKVTIPEDQLRFIINFDETCLSLDGTKGRRGGRPEITLHNPQFLYNGKRSNKDSLIASLVCGSNAAGEALPPHFQFQTKATTDEGQPGKRLLLKCDSGSGRLQIELLAMLRYLGVYLYPCVPNTTAVTQETDRTYGRFKSQYKRNLKMLVNELVRLDKSVSFLSTSMGCWFLAASMKIRG
jgi:hypothetical protein